MKISIISGKPFLITGLLLLLCFSILCTSLSSKRFKLLSSVTQKEDYAGGIKKIRKNSDDYGNLNRFLFWFDLGVLFHYKGDYDSSNTCLHKAESIAEDLFTHSITNEAVSLLTNDNIRPYRPRRYERILLHQFSAFNYLAKGLVDESLVESRKVQLVFDQYKSDDRRRGRYNDNGLSHYVSSIMYDASGEEDEAVISLYKSVNAYNNSPLDLPGQIGEFACMRLYGADRKEDVRSLGLKCDSVFSRDNILVNRPGTEEIILVGYGGKGPYLGETLFWGTYVVGGMLILYYSNPQGDTLVSRFPAPPLPERERRKLKNNEKTEAGGTFHIKFALPSVVQRESATRSFSASVDSEGKVYNSVKLSDTDVLLKKDLEDNFTKTILRTALRTVIRTIAAQRFKERIQSKSPLLNLVSNVGTDIAADQIEKADTRLCFLMPGTIHLIRIPVSRGTHSLSASALDGAGNVVDKKSWSDISVKFGDKKFLFYPCLK